MIIGIEREGGREGSPKSGGGQEHKTGKLCTSFGPF
jgi:hypothetical protein